MYTFFKSFLFLVCIQYVSAQDVVNQFDADGKRHGVWKKMYEGTNLLRYEGTFLNGKEIGLFKFYKNIKNKSVLAFTKQFNKVNNIAEVKFFDVNGKVVGEGKMKGKVYIGKWKFYQEKSNNLLTLENYNENGLLDGERLVYYANKQVAEQQNYINGKLEGESNLYSRDGVLLKQFIYLNDELNGLSKFFNSNGELIAEGYYKNGKKNGVWKYYKEGKLTEKKVF